MKNRLFLALFLCFGLSIAASTLTSCSAGASIGNVGARASVGR